jgi:hypothetical protein
MGLEESYIHLEIGKTKYGVMARPKGGEAWFRNADIDPERRMNWETPD